MRIRLSLLLIISLLLSNYAALSQSSPAGVGNTSGTLGQPENVIWFSADSLTLSNNTPLVTWNDLSGNSNDATQATANRRPAYRTGQINGKPAIVFDPNGGSGNQDCLPFDGNTIANSDYTVLFVGQRRSSSSFKIFMGGTTSSSNQNLHLYWRYSSQFRAHQYGNDLQTNMVSSGEVYSSGTNSNEYGIFTTLLASTESSRQRKNYQNNHYLGYRSNSAQLSSYNGAAIARYGSSYYGDVDVAEFIVYSNALNEAQLQIVHQYLNVKYNINIDNDLFDPLSPYIHNVVGVGSSDGTNAETHSQTSGSGGGLLLAENEDSFDEANEFVFAAHNNATATEVSSSLPALGTGALTGRSNRIWYVDRSASTTTDISIGFNLSETGLGAGVENQIYYLLHRTGTSGTFATVTGGVAILSDGEVWFNIEDANFSDGYYTIARSDQVGRTWYSYNTGDWDNWLTWTLEQGGAGIVNPDNLTPTTSPTASIDKVVILQPYIVTVSSDNKSNALLEVRDGELNLQSTTGHVFENITGQGVIRLSDDNFPSGNSTVFNGVNGGTVEYNGTGHNLSTARTFNNLTINLTNSLNIITLMSDYTLNGKLTVEKGNFRINDDFSNTILNIDVAGDLVVESTGEISIGEASTIGSYSIAGNMPNLGEYHSIFHQVKIGGGMTNEGTVSFTNLAAPDYAQFASNGAATVTFYGANNDTLDLDARVNFYNLIIDKGIDQTYILDVDSENDDYFQLYGPNNVGRRTGGVYTDENPEVRKALWIKNGTLKLSGFISIPSLSEGSQAGGNGDYAIPANARLWIAGDAVNNVRVFSTARTSSAELLPGTVGVNDGGSNQAMSVYGSFKMTNGYFNTRNSAGFIFWADASAVVDISGGLTDVAQFRSAHGIAGGKTSFVMSGGELMVRGNEQFTYNLDAGAGYSINPDGNGEITGSYPTFGIIDPDGVFQMDGGKIYIADESGNNDYNSNALCINAQLVNHNVTGGTIYLLPENNENFDIVSQGPLYNLTTRKLSGTSNANIHMGSDISLKGSLNVGDYTTLISRRQHSGYNDETHDLEVARSFTVQNNGDYRAYDNTTTVLVTYTSSLTLRNTNQEFFNLVVKNNPDLPSTLRQFNGNNNTVTVHNDFTVETGANFNFRNGNKDLIVKGNIYNSGTITTDVSSDVGAVLLTDKGIVSSISINWSGTYSGIPTITIAAPGGGGATATAIPVFDGIPGTWNRLRLTGIIVTNSGSGYTSVPTVTISGGGGWASASAHINTQHEIGGDGNGVFANLEIDEPHPSEASGEVDVTYLAASQTVSNVLTLTDGVFDLETYNLYLAGEFSTEGSANEETLYSETKLIRMAGNHGDGGLTRYIDADGDYLYPIGTYNNTDRSNRYGWAKQTISSFSDDGKIQINAIPRKLPTLSDDGSASAQRYLEYYWRVQYDDFSSIPNVHNRFVSYVDDYTWNGAHTNHIIGKIVDLVRYNEDDHGLGTLESVVSDKRILNYSTVTVLEEGEFTAGFKPIFNGSIEVFYSRNRGTAGSPAWWRTTSSWVRKDQLIDANTDGNIDELDWHWSTQPAASDYPKAGDIAVIGWTPWGDTGAPGVEGDPHHIRRQDGGSVTCGQIIFNQMKDAGGNPVASQSWDSYFFRPTLTVSNNGSNIAQINASIISGEGTIRCRRADPDFSSIDISDFVNEDSAYILYEVFSNVSLNNIPSEVPNLYLSPDGWGSNDRTITIPRDIEVNGNLEVRGGANLQLYNGAVGDITVHRNLILDTMHHLGSIYTGTRLQFQNNGTARTLTVHGDIYVDGRAAIFISNANSGALEHTINLYGDYIQNTTASDLGGGQPVMRLYTGSSYDRATLNMLGTENAKIAGTDETALELYRLIIDKGATDATIDSIQIPVNLNGSNSGDHDTKSLYLKNGTLVLNHPSIDITLSSGGEDFYIPSSTGLNVTQGTARITTAGSNGILLDGTLIVSAYGANQGSLILDGGVGSDNYIEYSSSGNAGLKVSEGYLYVGSQVRSSTLNSLGVLKYTQTTNTSASTTSNVIIGARSAPVNTRGVFEIMNPGSRFRLYGGKLTIARAHDAPGAATRAALYLDPETIGLNKWSNIQIGLTGTTPASSTITINSTEELCHLWVDGNTTAQLDVNSLSLVGDLDILSGSSFDGNGLDLTLKEDIVNRGTADINVGTIYFTGDIQEIDGDISVNDMSVEPTTSLTLSGATNTVEVTGDLDISSGQLDDGGHLVVVDGDIVNDASHTSSGTGRIKLNGSSLQLISGAGAYGSLELDNTFGARIQNSISINNDFYLTNGILDIQDLNLSFSESSDIIGSGFGPSKMIVTDGSFADLGVTKGIPSGGYNFTFPIGIGSGVGAKYTPVEFDITSSTQGTIRLHPVNQSHMTAVGPNVLQYFWNIASSGLTGFNAKMKMYYDDGDVVGTESDYISAWLYGDSWSKFPTSTVDEAQDSILFSFPGVNDISGDYTAGIDAHIPNDIPVYESVASGDWSTTSIWSRLDGEAVPAGGPNGHIVRVMPGHTVKFDRYQVLSYRTEIEGRLEVGADVGHNMGYVSGSGTLALVTQKMPVADLTDFLASGTGSTIEYGGGTYTIPDLTNYGNYYNNLTITGAGTKTLPNTTIRIRNELQVLNNADLEIRNRLILYEGITKDNSAAITHNTSSYIAASGSAARNFNGLFTGTSAFKRLLINCGDISANDDIEVYQQLMMYNGVIEMPAGKSLKLSGSSLLHYNDDSYIDGRFVRSVSNGATGVLFPVGKDTKPRFTRLYSVSSSGVLPEEWSVEYFDSDPSLAGMDTSLRDDTNPTKPVHKVSGAEYWMIDGPTPGSASVSVEWGEESGVDDAELSGIILVEWDGAQWISRQGTANSTGTGEGYINSTDASSFSTKYFSIGADAADNPLPIELLSFDARAVGKTVEVSWQTATEINNDYFVIERTKDGINFEEVTTVFGAGNSNQLLVYSILDANPYMGVSYYRLKQVDFDGTYTYSYLDDVVIEETEGLNEFDFVMYPNPVTENQVSILLQNSKDVEVKSIRIVDIMGKTYYYKSNLNENRFGDILNLQFDYLQPGIYNVIIVANDEVSSKKLVVR